MADVFRAGDITVTDLGSDGAQVRFPKNLTWVADLKATFPKGRWMPQAGAWGVPGKLAYKRACQWAEKVTAGDNVANRQRLIDGVAFDGPAGDNYVRLGVAESTVSTIYDDEIVAICRRLGGTFDRDRKVWRIPGANLRALIAARPEIIRLATAADARAAARTAAIAAEKVARRAQYAAEREAQDARMAAVRASRYVVVASDAPAVGATVRLYGRAVTVESLGKAFRADEDISSLGGPVGAEGEWVRYAYYRPATPEEAAALEAGEAGHKRQAEITRAQQAAVRSIGDSADAPDLGSVPEGETIWSDDRSAAVGWRTWVILTADGWLWHVTYDGTDGGMWGTYNCGYNTVGRRVRATSELVAAIRGEA